MLAVAVLAGCSGASSIFGGEPEGPTLVDDKPPPVGPPAPQPPPAPPPLVAPPTTPPTMATPTTTTEPQTTWTLLAGGDVLMDRSEPAGINPFEFIDPPLASADLAVVNAEMAISDRGTALAKQYVFRAPPSAAATIAAAGVDVANLANNHAGDFGPDALLHTIELLEQAGVVALGAGSNAATAYRHRLLDVGGAASVALVGASMIVPWGFEATAVRPGIASTWNTARVLDSVRAAAGEADVVVAVVHWGIERDPCPTADQRSLARALIAAGADVVIGHHPHVLQPVEFIAGAVVAYSLGNFVWHPRGGFTGETGVLQVDFDADTIVGWSFHPHLLDGNGAPRPAADGDRLDRIEAIIGGDCDPYRPPPTTTTTPTESEAGPLAEPPTESEAGPLAEPPTESPQPATDEALELDATP